MSKLKDTEIGKKYHNQLKEKITNMTPKEIFSGGPVAKIDQTEDETIAMLFGSKGARIRTKPHGAPKSEFKTIGEQPSKVLREDVVQHICDNCGKTYKTKSGLTRHKKTCNSQ